MIGCRGNGICAIHVSTDIRMMVSGMGMRVRDMVHLDGIGRRECDGSALFLRLLLLLRAGLLVRIEGRPGLGEYSRGSRWG